ncbi:MAG TPA: DUF3892 domain-containing protein [Galbitalea sp.]|nr:DUF3892 domain-containing protein [Galbitalea sp.]
MTTQIVARHMAGGQDHQHVAEVEWINITSNKTGKSSRDTMVAWLDDKTANHSAIVVDAKEETSHVGTVHPTNSAAYIRSYKDKVWNDNLLALPTY